MATRQPRVKGFKPSKWTLLPYNFHDLHALSSEQRLKEFLARDFLRRVLEWHDEQVKEVKRRSKGPKK